MTYKGILSFCFFLLYTTLSFSQINVENPFSSSKNIISENEIIMLWSDGTSEISANKNIYEVNNASIMSEHSASEPSILGNGHFAVATGDFNGDGHETFIVAWEQSNTSGQPILHYYLPTDMDGTNMDWTEVNQWEGGAQLFAEEGTNHTFRQIKLVTGDFDGDFQDEFVIGFHSGTGRVRLLLFDTNGSVNQQYVAQINWKHLPDDNKIYASQFDLAVGDFNWDGREDLVLIAAEAAENGSLDGAYLSIFTIDETDGATNINHRLQHHFPMPNFSLDGVNMGVTTGDFSKAYTGLEIACAINWDRTNDNPDIYTYLYTFRVASDMTNPDEPIAFHELIFDENINTYSQISMSNVIHALDLEAGDLDGDLEDEIVFGIGSQAHIFEIEDDLMPTRQLEASIPLHINDMAILQDGLFSNDFLKVKNVSGDFRAEVVVLKNRVWVDDPCCDPDEQEFDLTVYGFDTSSNPNNPYENRVTRASLIGAEYGIDQNHRRYALALGDFNGDNIRLGTPNIYEKTELVSPLMLLNPPPTHFDILNETIYDVSRRYCATTGCTMPGDAPADGEHHFTAIYEEIVTEANGLATEFHSDWAVSASAEANVSAFGFSLGASYAETYGERFSKTNQQRTEVILTQTNQATLDDDLSGYYIDYKVFEYPIIQGAQELGHTMVCIPEQIGTQTANVKSIFWETYQPQHEFGNLFSYPSSIEDIQNMGVEIMSPNTDISANATVIAPQSGGGDFFELVISEESLSVEQEAYTTETTVGASAGGSYGGFGIDVSVEGTYSTEDVETRTSSLGEEVAIRAFYGNSNANIADADYRITPIIYWAKNGGLVMDYLVDLQGAFWTNNYGGKCDPTFLLPWKYDEEKGFILSEPAEKQKTRDIWFSPAQPQTGESVTIFARLNNYSLEDTPSPVKVHFYQGEPQNGGTFIGEVTSETTLKGRINGVEPQIVELAWTIPANIDPQTRIYAVIDPNAEINNEVHEDNNTGWNCLLNPNCSGLALAIEWLNFEAFLSDDNQVQLTWESANVEKGDDFYIEHSTDALHFRRIGAMEVKEDVHHQPIAFDFIDEKPAIGRNYYRIKQVDKTGYYSLSTLQQVTVTNKATTIQVYPNPANDELYIRLSDKNSELITITVCDVLGNLVMVEQGQVVEGEMMMGLADLKNGIYTLVINNGVQTVVKKIVKE